MPITQGRVPPATRPNNFSKNYATCSLVIRDDSQDALRMNAYKSGVVNIK